MKVVQPLPQEGSLSARAIASWQRMRPVLGRLRVIALLAGCALLFWQHDGAPADWLFAGGIVASVALWSTRRPTLDIAWPQALVIAFVVLTGLATLAAGGGVLAFLITAYLVAFSLAIASVLREDPRRLRVVELGVIFSGCVAAMLTCLGYAARHFGWQPLELLSYDAFRGMGLFKDPNVAGTFTACAYPIAAARAARGRFSVVLLPAVTAVFGLGVIFSFSREALLIFALAVIGVIVTLSITRHFRPIVSLVVVCAIAVLSAGLLDRLPAYRGYELLAAYDQHGRFIAWRFGVEMLREAPLGTGSGSFERRSEARFDDAVNSLPTPLDTTNLVAPPAVNETAGFHSSLASAPAVLNLKAAAVSDPITFSFRNTGARAWKRGVSGQEARLGIGESGLVLEAGKSPVIARFSHVDDRTGSALVAGWPTADRVATQIETEVGPGAEGTFTFQIRAPRQAGTYRLHLRPVIEGVTWMEDQGAVLELNVTSTADLVGTSVPSTAAAAGGEVIAPAPPSAYPLPDSAVRVSTAAELVRALADPSPHDIVLANGSYDSSEPFYNPYGHRMYAATLGGAVLRAGLSLGANEGPGNGRVQGITFDVSDAAKTLANSVVNIWGAGAGSQVMDVTIIGNRAVAKGIAAQSLERVGVYRTAIRDVTDYGVVVLSGKPLAEPIVLEDLSVAGVRHVVAGSSDGKTESCVWLGSNASVRRAMVRSCGFAGIWTGAGNTGSVLEHIDIDGARVGVHVDDTVSQLSVRYLHVGAVVSDGVVVVGLAARQPGGSASAGDLVVVPSAHNTYIRVPAESGALGFLAFAAYLILMFWSLWSRGWREHWGLNLGLGLVLIAGLGIDTLHWRQLWLYLGIAAAVGVRNPAPVRLVVRTRLVASLVALVGRWRITLRIALTRLIGRGVNIGRRSTPDPASATGSTTAPAEVIDALDLRAELLRRDAARAALGPAPASLLRSDAESALQGSLANVWRTALSTSIASSAQLSGVLRNARNEIVDRWLFARPAVVRTAAAARNEAARLPARALPRLSAALRSVGAAMRTEEREAAGPVLDPSATDAPSALDLPQPGAVPAFDLPGPDATWVTPQDEPLPRALPQTYEEDLERARSRLAAKEITLGYQHPEVAAELHLIGAIHHDAGRPTEAVEFYSAALAIRERVLGIDHPEVASTLEDLALAREEEGEGAEAQTLLARAQAIRASRRPTEDDGVDADEELSLSAQSREDAAMLRLEELLGGPNSSRGGEPEL